MISELFDLTGRTALVTGGSRGLGYQIAEGLGEAGARVVITARNAVELDLASSALRGRGVTASWIAGDASDPRDVSRVCRTALAELGDIHILVNGAGAAWTAPAEDHPLEAWDRVMNLNVRAAFLFSQWLAKHSMIPRRAGRILMIASTAGLAGHAGQLKTVAYNASKAAMINLARQLASEWGVYNITVNAIAPGWFPSRMSRAVLEAEGTAIAARAPLRRVGDDTDLKGASLLFVADAGKHITGQVLAVDGGMSAVIG